MVAALASTVAPARQAEANSPVEDTYRLVQNRETGQYMAATGTSNGAKVIQTSYDGTADQYWRLEKIVDVPGGDYYDRYWLRNRTGRCAGIGSGALYNGAGAILSDCNPDAWANFWFVRSVWTSNGYAYKLVNVWSGKCLAIPNGDRHNGTQASVDLRRRPGSALVAVGRPSTRSARPVLPLATLRMPWVAGLAKTLWCS
ncbi:RICIN domain-containing protein [Kribbella sp. NPDC003505]|uniref:RICIN domain-containing protein n=1 Tax=Kribbella sp. NPDC003505 TaxID=3154448 RepID=UPI0033A13B89